MSRIVLLQRRVSVLHLLLERRSQSASVERQVLALRPAVQVQRLSMPVQVARLVQALQRKQPE
jgi:hypothetical protein